MGQTPIRYPFVVVPVALAGPLPTIGRLRALEPLDPALIVQLSLHEGFLAEGVDTFDNYISQKVKRFGHRAGQIQMQYKTLDALDTEDANLTSPRTGTPAMQRIQDKAHASRSVPIVMAFEEQMGKLLPPSSLRDIKAGNAYGIMPADPEALDLRLSFTAGAFCEEAAVRMFLGQRLERMPRFC